MGTRKSKITYPPLLEVGFKRIQVDDIEQIFVGINQTPKRKMLASMLRLFVQKLRSLSVKGELWIDGSFSTKNPEPMDIDVLLVIPRVTLSSMTPSDQAELLQLSDDRELTRARWSCDLYVIESSNIGKRKYYEEWFSNNPDSQNKKGIPVIVL